MKKSAAFLAGAMVVAAASPAAALGLNYGVRAGYGIGMPDPDTGVDSASVIDAGLGVMLDLAILGLEVDLLYNQQTTKIKGGGEGKVGNIAIPILARGSFPVIPAFLSLDFGGGLEPRFPISAEFGGVDVKDDMESMPLYLPIFIGTTLDIKLVKLNLDIRYERQLTASSKANEDARFHELVFMAGGFF